MSNESSTPTHVTEEKPNTSPFVTGPGLSRAEHRAHVMDTVERAWDAGWRGSDADAGHSPTAHQVISDELVRLTLGGRGPARPELRPLWHTCALDHYALLSGRRDEDCAGCTSLGRWTLAAVQHAEAERARWRG